MTRRKVDESSANDAGEALRRRHLLIGWWSLLAFLSLGLVLDLFHGLKVGWYMNVENASRRLRILTWMCSKKWELISSSCVI